MSLRTALTIASLVIAVKAVLIGFSWRGRCALMGQCGPVSAWYLITIAVIGVLILVAVFVAYRRTNGR